MELKDIKDAKTWSISEIADAICFRKKDIEKLENDLKKLREFKWQKVFEEMKPKLVDSKIDDLSLDDVQQLLLSKKTVADVDDKTSKSKKKSSRVKKDAVEKTDDKDDDDDSSSPESAAVENIDAVIDVKTENTVDVENTPEENSATAFSQPDVTEKKIETLPPVTEITTPEIGKQDENTDALNNPLNDEELFEDAISQPKSSTPKELQKIADSLNLPTNANLADVRKAFGAKINELPPAIAVNFEQMLGKLERGEIA